MAKKRSPNPKYTYDLSVFYREDDISYYLLGAFMTDGCVKVYPNRILPSITSKDKDWLEAIRDLICKQLPVSKIKGSNCWILQIYSTELGRWLISKGCGPKKSITLKFPSVPERYMPDFLRGCVDGDGGVYFYHYPKLRTYVRRCQLTSASASFASSYSAFIASMQLSYTVITTTPKDRPINFIRGKPVIQKHDAHTIRVDGKHALKFVAWLYYPGHRLSMARKYAVVQRLFAWKPIKPTRKPAKNGAKLNESKVIAIKRLIASGEKDIAIANSYVCTREQIGRIRRGQSWAHITV
jgi:hypothetical protein